ELSSAQQHANDELTTFFAEKAKDTAHPVALLHGITASGKTEVYINRMKAEIEAGMQVLYLLPEIALTTQIITRLQRYFGDATVVYHSRFNQNERVEVWNKVRTNNGG
ncbi:MAG: DEAD/DEAH box helicase, partial [Cryomorphaceae bacterium]